MKKIILFILIVVTTIVFTSCTTQQRIVYRDCDCNTTTFRFGWNNHSWGWSNLHFYPYTLIPQYYIPNRIQPKQPTRYERRQSVGARPGRVSSDNIYPQRTPSIPRVEVRPSQQNRQPSRIQQRTNTPTTTQPTRSRVQNR